ncbi:MOLPALP family lipoprotein [Spiroplasma tabanidicola]|uniref:MOLPALP family lipoprotein n=1 Tax=Spiroplasma tabanidicola TaxID=324079 RepID=A0A6I6CCV7_9MOLU|nr:MOLPALP family lipoprotein [Spiroplasma tabanidicola]QGS51804.1 hypothetical protein STABA_v1c04410 [Spiroplasma tabanidicola]
MKKLLAIVSALSMSTTVFSVTSCSLVNYKKQYIKNKVDSIVDVASVASRGAILNDAEGISVDYLNNYIGSKKMNDMLPTFKATPQAKVSDFVNATFEDPLDKKFYTGLGDSNGYTLDDGISPDSFADSIIDTGSTALSAIKSAGGIKPSLGGILESLLPEVGGFLSDDGVDFKMSDNALNTFEKLAPYAQQLLNDFGKTGIVSILCRLFFNINFINSGTLDQDALKELVTILTGGPDKSTVVPFILEDYINEIMFNDFKGKYQPTKEELENQDPEVPIDVNLQLTPKVVQQSALVRLNKLLIRLSGRNIDANTPETDPIRLQLEMDDYHPIDKPEFFKENLGENILYLVKNKDKLNYVAIIENISDLFFILCSLIINIGIFDFEQMDNTLSTSLGSDSLFYFQGINSNMAEVLDNKTFASIMNNQKDEKKRMLVIDYNNSINSSGMPNKTKFSAYKLLKNITRAVNVKDSKSMYSMQRIFFLLCYSNASRNPDEDPNKPFGVDYKLSENANLIDIVKLGALTGGMFNREVVGVDSLLNGIIQGIGYKILDMIDGVSIPGIIKGLGGSAISRLAGVLLDTISNNRSIQGVSSILYTINTFFDTGIKISDETTAKMAKGFNALWDKDSQLITELLNKKLWDKPINIQNLLGVDLGDSGTIESLLKKFTEYYNDENRKNYDKSKPDNRVGLVNDGITTLARSLKVENKIQVVYKSDKSIVKNMKGTSGDEDGKYNPITIALNLIKFPGYAVKGPALKPGSEEQIYAGAKGALYALGYVDGQKTFNQGSPLAAIENIFDDESVIKIRDNALSDFKSLSDIKKEYIKTNIDKYIVNDNFSYKMVSYSNITDEDKYGNIEMEITYRSPIDGVEKKYQVKLIEYATKRSWTIESTKKL